MPAGFYKLKVGRIHREAPDAVSIQLLVPPPFRAQFGYLPGQYLTFSITINGEEVRRSYSVCSSPFNDPMPVIAVKEVPGGKMSTYMNRSIKEGDLIDVMPPNGKFTVSVDASRNAHYFLYGGGSGITPLMSILLSILEHEPNSRVTLLYANRNKDSVIFGAELEKLAQNNSDRFVLIHSFDEVHAGWGGLSGLLNTQKIVHFVNEHNEAFALSQHYICGPSGMMDVVKNGLQEAGVPVEQIHTEYFTAVVREKSDDNVQQEADEDDDHFSPPSDRRIKVELYGMSTEVNVRPDQTVLQAVQDAGLDPPYSCTVGVCTTCRARLRNGKANMDEREGLSDAEISEGYILTCQAHPTSDDVDLVYE
jgi:ring-1,2-phenylacetyl-CoA epoxidase subunit PaaE